MLNIAECIKVYLMTANEKFIVEVMNGFQLNRGKGSVYCVKPFTPYKLVAKCIITFFNKHIDKRILIIVETYNIRIELLKALDELAPNRNFEVKILTAAYINPKYRYDTRGGSRCCACCLWHIF